MKFKYFILFSTNYRLSLYHLPLKNKDEDGHKAKLESHQKNGLYQE